MRCSKCHIEKQPEGFSVDISRKSGRFPQCKECRKLYLGEYVAREKPEPTSMIRRCTKCLVSKKLSEFYKDKSRSDGYSLQCKLCKCAKVKEYREDNPEKIKTEKITWKKTPAGKECEQRYQDNNREDINARKRQRYADDPDAMASKILHWRINNPERAKAIIARGTEAREKRLASLSINDFDDTQWKEILALFNYLCAYCHESFNSLERDHIFPVSKGGPNTKSNIATCCRSCNSKKGDKIMDITQAQLLERLASRQPLFTPGRRRKRRAPTPPASPPPPAPTA